MSDERFSFAASDEIDKRHVEFYEFIQRMFDEDERPFFVSDEACLYDIHAGDDNELSERCEKWYGRKLSSRDFLMPIWKLLDELYHSDDEGKPS